MSLTFNKFSLLFVTQHCHHQTGCWRATGRRSDEVTKWCWWCCLNCRRRWGGEPEGWFHPRRLSKWLRITDIPASLSPLLKPMARDSWRLKPTGGVVWSRTCSFPLKSCKPVKWNGSKSSTEAKQREQAVLSLPAPFVLFEFDCGGWVKPHQGGQTFWVFRTSPALNGRGEVTASDPEPKQRPTGSSSRRQAFESKRFCLYVVWKLRWQHWRSQVVQTDSFSRQEDNRWDFGCWLNCSNWRLNEFTELTGRGWANEAPPRAGGDPTGRDWGPSAAQMCRNSAGNLQVIRK